MIDPVTALATASSAFNLIKKGFSVGRDVESMGKDLGRWMGAMSDLKKADEYAKKPPLFKKIFASGSVEEEAMAAYIAKKKAEDMRDELRQMITMTRGPSAWQELVNMEAKIRKQRQQAIYDQKERQRKLFEGIAIAVLIAGCIAILVGGAWWLMEYKANRGY
ncbi:MAG: hypothetical protein CBD35_06580 [Verrucomicrobia bacterium TMED175]|nr:MAG: hypothetical protein CBD35_06580 [Verrucomicrobia bacterium TMED175]